MIEIITAAGFALAWFAFRYDRHRRWRGEIDAAHGTLRAVHHGMVQGPTPGGASGWGQYYFTKIYTEDVAKERARKTRDLVEMRGLDYILVAPTEPLALLATTAPRPGLIDSTTVAIANFALWRVNVFNQLVRSLGDFLTAHAAEITSEDTGADRRRELALGAMSLSLFVHLDGVGQAWAVGGWYRALVTAATANINRLEELQRTSRWRWLREWPYVLIDLFALAGVIVVIASVAAS
jgi:hypothetical protein